MTKRNDKWLALVAAIALGFGVAGCGSDGDDEGGDNVQEPAPFPDDSGQGSWNQAPDYPTAPTGWSVGSILPNYKFLAWPNNADDSLTENGDRMGDIAFVISMAEFYNPTGDGVYPEGSVFGAGNPKPKALLLDMSAVWCPPCREEAAEVLPGKFAQFYPMGGQFVTVLVEDNYGDPAGLKDLGIWGSAYAFVNWNVDGKVYVLGIDPAAKVSALFEPAYPSNAIIRTRDMKIMHIVAGLTPESFWTKFEQVINDTYPEP